MKIERIFGACLLGSVLFVAGCGDDENSTIQAGKVVQGPVSGAIVLADRNSNGTQDTGELTAVTGTNGSYTLTLPAGYGSYRLVTFGGTDTITNQPAAQLIAEAGSQNITPFTTLIATVPAAEKANLLQKLTTLGLASADADISTNATPAVIALAKSVESALTALKSAATTNYGLSVSLQEEAAKQIASALVASSSALTDPAVIASTISSAVKTALTTVDTSSADLTLTAAQATAIAASVQTSIQTIATAIQTAAGGTLGTTSASAIAENTVMTQSLITSVSTATQTITSTVQANSAITANTSVTPPTPPVTGSTGGSGTTGTK